MEVAEQVAEGLESRINLKSGLMAAPQDVGCVEGGGGGVRWGTGLDLVWGRAVRGDGGGMSLEAWQASRFGEWGGLAPRMTSDIHNRQLTASAVSGI